MKTLDVDKATQYYATHYLDASKLVWNFDGTNYTMNVASDQWAIIQSIDKNMFLDDGEGYIDMGLDELFDYNNGVLTGNMTKAWIAVNGQLVAYYHTDDQTVNGKVYIYGYIPALLNGERVELQVVFDENGKGTITGAVAVYKNNETDTVAKSETEEFWKDENGNAKSYTIDFIADYYTYNGDYQDTYKLGTQITVSGDPATALTLSDLAITSQTAKITYRFTDMYGKEYWTDPVVK